MGGAWLWKMWNPIDTIDVEKRKNKVRALGINPITLTFYYYSIYWYFLEILLHTFNSFIAQIHVY